MNATRHTSKPATSKRAALRRRAIETSRYAMTAAGIAALATYTLRKAVRP